MPTCKQRGRQRFQICYTTSKSSSRWKLNYLAYCKMLLLLGSIWLTGVWGRQATVKLYLCHDDRTETRIRVGKWRYIQWSGVQDLIIAYIVMKLLTF